MRQPGHRFILERIDAGGSFRLTGRGWRNPVLGKVDVAEGNPDSKDAALTETAGGLDRSPMKFYEFLNQSQADAGAFKSPSLGALDTVEALEDMGELALWHASSGIGDPEDGLFATRLQTYGHAALKSELEGVGKQIEHDLFPHLPVHIYRFG